MNKSCLKCDSLNWLFQKCLCCIFNFLSHTNSACQTRNGLSFWWLYLFRLVLIWTLERQLLVCFLITGHNNSFYRFYCQYDFVTTRHNTFNSSPHQVPVLSSPSLHLLSWCPQHMICSMINPALHVTQLKVSHVTCREDRHPHWVTLIIFRDGVKTNYSAWSPDNLIGHGKLLCP